MIPSLANHLWQSTLFAGAMGLLTLALKKEPGFGAVLVVAGRVGQVSGAFFRCWFVSESVRYGGRRQCPHRFHSRR